MSLTPWSQVAHPDAVDFLRSSLGMLFESSPILDNKLAPELAQSITSSIPERRPKSYSELIDLSSSHIKAWNPEERASFIAGHPRIGEVSNLSTLSAAEQATKATPPEVLSRLEYLNAQYERAFPGLRYITFVNGRSRAQIVPEMEGVLELQGGGEKEVGVRELGSSEWTSELDRAIDDVVLIAKSRLRNLGVE